MYVDVIIPCGMFRWSTTTNLRPAPTGYWCRADWRCHVTFLIATLIDTGWNMFQVNSVSHQPFKQSRNAMVLHWTVIWHCGCIEVGPWSHCGWDHFRKTICCWKRLGISTWVTLLKGIPTRDEEFRAMAQNSNSSSRPGLWLATRQQS